MLLPSSRHGVLTRLDLLQTRSNFYSTLSPSHSIYVSKSTNPYFNLTLEDWLFRHKKPTEPLLLIYRDDPCVVIGRNQNPWKEVNFEASKKTGIPFIRRRSGGGTVFHDLGNTNYSIHLPRQAFDRYSTAQVVLKAVRSLGIDALVNDRNDICVGQEKVSGSAYKIVNNRAYHHGTMLISTELGTLGDLLRVQKDAMVTKGVASVRSPVCNLRSVSDKISHETFTTAMIEQFLLTYQTDEKVHYVQETDEVKGIEYVQRGIKELQSWDWSFGQTPEFTYTMNKTFSWGDTAIAVRSRHGVILSCTFDHKDLGSPELHELGAMLEGQRYGFVDLDNELGHVEDRCLAEAWGWLKTQI